MMVHLLVHKSAKNNLIKGELKGALYIALEDTPKILLWEELKAALKFKKNMHLTLQVMLYSTVQARVHLREYIRLQLVVIHKIAISSAHKVAISGLHEDVQEGAFDATPKASL